MCILYILALVLAPKKIKTKLTMNSIRKRNWIWEIECVWVVYNWNKYSISTYVWKSNVHTLYKAILCIIHRVYILSHRTLYSVHTGAYILYDLDHRCGKCFALFLLHYYCSCAQNFHQNSSIFYSFKWDEFHFSDAKKRRHKLTQIQFVKQKRNK